MKKSLSILVLLVLSLSILVSAQSNESNLTIPKMNIKDPTPKIDEKLEQKVTIPLGLRTITRVGLGIDSNQDINLSEIIIIITLWILILIASYSTLKSIQTLGPIAVSISALAITGIIGSTKALSVATEKWLGNEDLFIFIDGWEFGNLIITIFAAIIFAVIVFMIREKVEKEIREDRKEEVLDAVAEESKSKIKTK